jgi:hypothetical protein
MPTPVRLDFVPPTQPDLTELHVEEAANKTGPYTEIFQTVTIGAYPNYISYITVDANNPNDWFRIYWLNADGAQTPYSEPVQGGTTTLVQQIVDRVMLRAPGSNEIIVTQTAEWAICYVLGVDDPYDPTLTATYRQLEGMTLLTLAGVQVSTITSSATAGESYSAGLVSQKSSSSSSSTSNITDLIDWLLEQANKLLGISMTYVMLLEEIDPTGIGVRTGIEEDVSRGIITEFTS